MSLFRPEALEILRRYREPSLALGAAAFGLWVATRGGYFYGTVGAAIVLFALGLALAAWRRIRFAHPVDAPGLVAIDEGAIAYFGPEEGGVAALSELEAIYAVAAPSGLAWRLDQSDGTRLTIPATASGAEQLFDVFGALPGASAEAFLSVIRTPPSGERRIWLRNAANAEARLSRP